MSSPTQPTTFLDLYTLLMNRVLSDTSKSATIVQAKREINIALQDMHLGFREKFPWAERQAVLVTKPRYFTGTVSVAVGGTTITGTDTLWDTEGDFGSNNMVVGGKTTIGGSFEVYEITDVASDTEATIGSRYVHTTEAVDAGYVYYEDDYALASDFLRPVDQRRFSDGARAIELIDRTEFRRLFPANRTPGVSKVATIVDRASIGSTARQRRIRLHPPPSKAMSIPYSYITSNLVVTNSGTEQSGFVNDDDEPIVPLQYRHAIPLHALQTWYRDKKDDARSQEVKAEYVDVINRIVADYEIGAVRTRIVPMVAPYQARARSPWRGHGGGRRFDTNGWFDRFEDIR